MTNIEHQGLCQEAALLFAIDEDGEIPVVCGLPRGHEGDHEDWRAVPLRREHELRTERAAWAKWRKWFRARIDAGFEKVRAILKTQGGVIAEYRNQRDAVEATLVKVTDKLAAERLRCRQWEERASNAKNEVSRLHKAVIACAESEKLEGEYGPARQCLDGRDIA